MIHRYLALAMAVVVAMTSCNQTSTQNEVADEFSESPLFDDFDGGMAQFYEENGYVYSQELVERAGVGDVHALDLLSTMYAYGIGGVAPDRNKAFHYYRALANTGDSDAQAITGYMLIYGLGPIENVDDGLEMLAESANQKNGLAYYFLGNFHHYNLEPTAENVLRAKLYYRAAAELGMYPALEELERLEVDNQ